MLCNIYIYENSSALSSFRAAVILEKMFIHFEDVKETFEVDTVTNAIINSVKYICIAMQINVFVSVSFVHWARFKVSCNRK